MPSDSEMSLSQYKTVFSDTLKNGIGMKPKEIFLRALKRKTVPRPATGSATSIATIDLMDKVGFYFPDVHTNEEKMAGLAASGYTELGFDNVMPLFSVCHESVALGCRADWGEIDRMPDCRGGLYGIEDDIIIPDDLLNKPSCRTPINALKIIKKRFGEEIAVVGKVFGPWTLGYHIFGIEEFLISTIINPDAVKRAIAKLKEVSVLFAKAQIEAGADAICLADHATRDLCSPDAYKEFLFEIHCELSERIPCPKILHICGDTSDRIGYIRQTGLDCFHYDSKVPAGEARELAGENLSLMGGTSNFEIIRKGTPETIINDVREKIDNNIDIIGPECAVPLDAPYINMKTLADAVKKT
ncbi:uroporphyrinogen decarboxylase family protein [Candidatus Latescibacterota bacterium]